MKKLSLISLAVLTAFSYVATSQAAVTLNDADNYRQSVTIDPINPDESNDYLSNQATNGRVDEVIASNAGSSDISYVKNEGKGKTLSIEHLILENGSEEKPTIATLEFWGKDNTVDQKFLVGKVDVGEYAVLRIQEGKQFLSSIRRILALPPSKLMN